MKHVLEVDFDFDFNIIWRAPRPAFGGASPTQPYKCGQNAKTNVKTDFDFDFNILTA